MMKGMKNTGRNSSRNYLAVGLIFGFFLVLLTYFTVSNQFANYTPNAIRHDNPIIQNKDGSSQSDEKLKDKTVEEKPNEEEAFERRDTFEETEQEIKAEEKLQSTKYDDSDKTLLLGNEGKKEKEQKKEIEQREESQKGDVIEVQQPEKEEKEKSQQEFNQYKNEDKKEAFEFEQTNQNLENSNQPIQFKPLCDQSNGKFDLCDLKGDARTIGSASMIILVPPTGPTPTQEYKIKPYSRKYLESIKPVTVKLLESPKDSPPCGGKVNYPAIVIALGGLSGNYWHDFTDILIPLFIRSREFNGNVQFLVTNNLPFWTSKYEPIFKKLSKYEIIDFDNDYEVRCFSRVLVSYGSHKEFSIDSSRSPNNYSITDFTKFIRTIYGANRDFPVKLQESPWKKPRLMIISRGGSRKFVNLQEMVQSAENLGFEVEVSNASPNNLHEFAKKVNSFDVMLGAHGAGLTNCIFLPPNAVLIQIVPYGKLEHLAKIDFGDPAVDMKLKYLEYSITAEESTLLGVFGKDHPMIKDPLAIHQSDWTKVAEWYLGRQDIKLDIRRFEPVLKKALEFLQ
ncbi:hypothetical protein LUZ60_012748 [Juncus effusus]|nr:hypothetical protein LUZ60_012748 [Juncus effusus]